jgi:hypothetical protein
MYRHAYRGPNERHLSPLLVPIGMPLESAFRDIVYIPAAALATQLLPVCLCNRLSWSVMIAVMCAAALLVVVDRLTVVLLLLLMVGLMLLAGYWRVNCWKLVAGASRGCLLVARSHPGRWVEGSRPG